MNKIKKTMHLEELPVSVGTPVWVSDPNHLDLKPKSCRKMSFLLFMLFFCIPSATLSQPHHHHEEIEKRPNSRSTIDLQGNPPGVVWVVQLSDLHFSVFHPERSLDFSKIVGPALAMIKPSLVLITGDLTDGTSIDMLTMKQNEDEWIEYHNVMEDVIAKSGLPKNIFFDLRGNHDNFGVPAVGGAFDFFQNYSISGGLKRNGNVCSVTLQGGGRKHLFVGFDSTMSIGLRGPTNLFGHPTDQLLEDLDAEFSQWESPPDIPVTKISFGHFPLSFSAASDSGKSLKDVFLKHSISAYLCGHLHIKFGENLKRHYQHMGGGFISTEKYFQLNARRETVLSKGDYRPCSESNKVSPIKEFWEWEMGDWRKSRIMRVLAIDEGRVSFVDINYSSGYNRTIILPTFPLDSRFMQRISSISEYSCQSTNFTSYEMIRALVFSDLNTVSVMVKIYESSSGNLLLIMEAPMNKLEEIDSESRGNLYTTPWNWRAFVDPSPDRFWMQIEAVDALGQTSFSQMRPISINGLTAKLDWKWKEFLVMGCQWDSLYQPILWSVFLLLLSVLLIPKAFLVCSKNQYTYNNFGSNLRSRNIRKWLITNIFWVLIELARVTSIWFGMLIYLVYLMFFPWFFGRVLTGNSDMGYLTHKGWKVKMSKESGEQSYIGVPDVMVIALPHLCYVVLPAVLVISAWVAEKVTYWEHYLLLSRKKEDDYNEENKRYTKYDHKGSRKPDNFCAGFCIYCRRWFRKLLLVVCFVILWRHLKNCRAVLKAYEANPFLHSPLYCWSIPILLAYAFYKTMGA